MKSRFRTYKRKASLNLSINAIVVLILAITMLGLGLGFMKKTFKSATGQFGTVSDEVRKEMINRMKDEPGKAFFSVYQLEIKTGEEKQIYLAVRNDLDKDVTITVDWADTSTTGRNKNLDDSDVTSSIKYTCEFTPQGTSNTKECKDTTTPPSATPDSVTIHTFTNFNIPKNDVKIVAVRVNANTNAQLGLYEIPVQIETTPTGGGTTTDYVTVLKVKVS